MLVDTDELNAGALTFFRRQGFGEEIRHAYLSLNMKQARSLAGSSRWRTAGSVASR